MGLHINICFVLFLLPRTDVTKGGKRFSKARDVAAILRIYFCLEVNSHGIRVLSVAAVLDMLG